MLSYISFILGMLLSILVVSVLLSRLDSRLKNTTKLLFVFTAVILISAECLFLGRNFIFPQNKAFVELEYGGSQADRTEQFDAEYNSVLEQMNALSRDTTFKVVSSEMIYQVDSLNNRISELNACIEKCKKHYKADWWNGCFYPKEIADKQPITQEVASEIYARFRLENKK